MANYYPNYLQIPQVTAAENQLSFQQKSSKHLEDLINGQMSKECCKTHLYTYEA